MIKLLLISILLLSLQIDCSATILNPSDDVKPLSLLNQPFKVSLTIQANVYFGDGDEETFPIAETDFYLLDESFIKILQSANFKPEFSDGKHRKIKDEDYLQATAQAFISTDDEESQLIALLIEKEISKHKVATVQTNYWGIGNLKKVKTGNYYLFAIGRTEDQVLVWNQAVKIVSGNNLIEIDQHNADVVFEAEE